MNGLLKRYFMLVLGVLLIAAAIDVFYAPAEMAAGGVSGLGIIILSYSEKYLGFGIPVSVTNIAINFPLFFAAYKKFGKSYIKRSLLASILFSLTLEVMLILPEYRGDTMLAAVFGGILSGTGVGFVLNASATTGGTEIAAELIHEKNDRLSVSDYIFLIDATVIMLGFFVFGAEKAMFSVISVYISSKCVKAVSVGSSYDKMALIISERPSDVISCLRTADCGKTSGLNSVCMYKNEYRNVLICIFSQNEITKLKETVKFIDNKAFIILLDINDVYGNGFKKF